MRRRFTGGINWKKVGRASVAGLVLGGLAARMSAVTLDDLLNDPKLTPKRFANYFEHFDYDYHPAVQPPSRFLENQVGDCDDYAILADHVLKQKGFTTRLVHVRMVGMVAHAVCYVAQSKAYLDYNNRIYSVNLERSGASLRQIAEKVADSMGANWSSATEFTYDYGKGRKDMGMTVVKVDSPSQDPDRSPS